MKVNDIRELPATGNSAGDRPSVGDLAGNGDRGPGRALELITALSMTIGRGRAARAVADLARIGEGDVVVDVGCGPGTAVREARRRGATAIGVDPGAEMLSLARWITAVRRLDRVRFLDGAAESLPLPDGVATVVWALSSVHHWRDRGVGVAEARRVLAPGGRLLLAERLVAPGARGHAAHGLALPHAESLARLVGVAGFSDVRCETMELGRRPLVIVRGDCPAGQSPSCSDQRSAAGVG